MTQKRKVTKTEKHIRNWLDKGNWKKGYRFIMKWGHVSGHPVIQRLFHPKKMLRSLEKQTGSPMTCPL